MSDLTEPVQSLDHLLAQVSRLHHYRAHELLDGLGLFRGQPPLLYALWEKEGQTHRELAEKLQITPATITKMIQRMEKTGFVQRQPDASDQRVSRVYLTDAGRAIRAQLETVWNQMEVEGFAGFNAEERVVLRSYLMRIRENLAQAVDGKIPF